MVTFLLDLHKPLDPAVIRRLKEQLAGRYVKHMLWESEPADAVRAQIQRELGLGSIIFNPCEALTPADLDSGANYVSVMKRNIADLKRWLD